MLVKAIFSGFLSLYTSLLLTADAIGQVDPAFFDRPTATKEDLNKIKVFIKKEFNLQGAMLKNEDEVLGQLKSKINTVTKSLDSVEAQESISLIYLLISNGLALGALILQISWL